uniref:Uncharacterized protein n=1 Tax=Glossina pallidipes TaxID=7398 RepID=A0A1B0A0I4_GLOPL
MFRIMYCEAVSDFSLGWGSSAAQGRKANTRKFIFAGTCFFFYYFIIFVRVIDLIFTLTPDGNQSNKILSLMRLCGSVCIWLSVWLESVFLFIKLEISCGMLTVVFMLKNESLVEYKLRDNLIIEKKKLNSLFITQQQYLSKRQLKAPKAALKSIRKFNYIS